MDVFIDSLFSEYYQRSPLVLVDIGARGGLQGNWRPAEKYLQTIGFEPDPHEFKKLTSSLKSESTKYLNAALHKDKGSLDFHLARSAGSSSIFRPDRSFLDTFPESDRFDTVQTIQLKTDTLDNQLGTHGISEVDFIKADTQGSELFILQGAKQALTDAVFGLEIEVEFAPMYEGQPLFCDVDKFVRAFGFGLLDLRPCYWKRTAGKRYGKPKGQIIFADALYFRTPASFAQVIAGGGDDVLKKSRSLRALSVCILYGYLDYALEIFEAVSGLFSPDEAKMFRKKLEQEVSLNSLIPNFRGRGRIADVFLSLYKIINPPYHGWATSQRNVGNVD